MASEPDRNREGEPAARLGTIEAVRLARRHGRSVEVKNFPECLLGEEAEALENDQPKLVIDPEFWPEFMRNGFHQCVHRSYCGAARCLGLNTAYVNKFGWHEDILVPLPGQEPAAGEPRRVPGRETG